MNNEKLLNKINQINAEWTNHAIDESQIFYLIKNVKKSPLAMVRDVNAFNRIESKVCTMPNGKSYIDIDLLRVNDLEMILKWYKLIIKG